MRMEDRTFWVGAAHVRGLISVAEVAKLLNLSQWHVREKLLRKHVLRPVVTLRGKKFVFEVKAEAYRRKRNRIARRALRDLAMSRAVVN